MSEQYNNVIDKDDLHMLIIKLNPRLWPKDLCGEEVSEHCPGCKYERLCRVLQGKHE